MRQEYLIIAVENNRHIQKFFVVTENLEETKVKIFNFDPNICFLIIHKKVKHSYQWDFIYHYR